MRAPSERGAVAIIVGILAVLLAGMAAFAVDVGALFNERRQVQAAADTGALSGSQEADQGIAAVSDQIAATVRDNLERTYTDSEWFSLWGTANCSDADAYEISGVVNGVATNCVSFDPTGIVRVRVPDIEVDTVFAGILGVSKLSAAASAEAKLSMPGGVLPFAMLAGASSGGEMCLKTATSGQAYGACDGPASGNFGALLSSIYGSLDRRTHDINCGTVNNGDNLVINASVGVDHMLLPHRGGADVFDTCAREMGPNKLETITGNNSASILDGLVNGQTVQGTVFEGLLTKTANATVEIRNGGSNVNQVDNRPLWEYIPASKATSGPDSVPADCTRESFDTLLADPANDAEDANAQMVSCLEQYAAPGPARGVLFDLDANDDKTPDIVESPRFGYVPRMLETSFPSGGSGWLTIDRFQAVYIQTLFFSCSGTGCSNVVHPGIDQTSINVGGGTGVLDQVSSLVFPLGSLPSQLEFENEILDFTTPELLR